MIWLNICSLGAKQQSITSWNFCFSLEIEIETIKLKNDNDRNEWYL